MKFFYRKFLTALLFLFFAFNAKATNDTLTIGQAFDWSVGDTFIYKSHFFRSDSYYDGSGYTTNNSSSDTVYGFVVESRINIIDSIIYSIRYFNDTIATDVIIGNGNQTVFNLFSIAPVNIYMAQCGLNNFNCNFSYFPDPDFNNTVTDYFSWGGSSEYDRTMVTEKVGIKKHEFATHWGGGGRLGGYGNMLCTVNLIYYKSASSGLIYNDVPETINAKPFFTIYPNPGTDEITITTETDAPVDVYIYDMLGNCVLSHKKFSHNLVDINVSLIPPGYYILKLTDQHGLSSSKGFIIAKQRF